MKYFQFDLRSTQFAMISDMWNKFIENGQISYITEKNMNSNCSHPKHVVRFCNTFQINQINLGRPRFCVQVYSQLTDFFRQIRKSPSFISLLLLLLGDVIWNAFLTPHWPLNVFLWIIEGATHFNSSGGGMILDYFVYKSLCRKVNTFL